MGREIFVVVDLFNRGLEFLWGEDWRDWKSFGSL
jgi:hypothetical protein